MLEQKAQPIVLICTEFEIGKDHLRSFLFFRIKTVFQAFEAKSASVFPDLSNQLENYNGKNIDQEKQHKQVIINLELSFIQFSLVPSQLPRKKAIKSAPAYSE